MLRPRFPAEIAVERGFARLPHGQMHYRAAGHGPVVVALHESPASSLSLQPLMAGLGADYRVIAPDTPGYGLSDPLPGTAPCMEDFLAALFQFLDTMGLGRVAIYGAHTGADLAVAFAARYPQRVTALALDGLSLFTPQEQHAFQKDYLPSYAPHWDGRHVMQIWSRVRDSFQWFPWYNRSASARLTRPSPSPEVLQLAALALVQAGAHYAKAYGISAAFDPRPALRTAGCPVTVMARAGDVLMGHLERLGDGPWTIERLSRDRDSWLGAILTALKRGPQPDRAFAKPPVFKQGSRFVQIGRGLLHARLDWRGSGLIRLLLPGLPGDGIALLEQQRRLHPKARLLAVDLPGCGWSDPLENHDIENLLAVLDELANVLDIAPRFVVGEGASAPIAALWAERRGCRMETVDEPVWLRNPAKLPSRPLLAPWQPKADGSHMTGAWFALRDLMLSGCAPQPPDLHRLQTLFRSLVEGPQAASLLALAVELVRLWPDVIAVPAVRRSGNGPLRAGNAGGHAGSE